MPAESQGLPSALEADDTIVNPSIEPALKQENTAPAKVSAGCAAVVFLTMEIPSADIWDLALRAEVKSTSFSFRFSFGAEVGQSDASCGGRQLAEVQTTSAR
jgi:hypothetical protein